jgi:hypothetical protein
MIEESSNKLVLLGEDFSITESTKIKKAVGLEVSKISEFPQNFACNLCKN